MKRAFLFFLLIGLFQFAFGQKLLDSLKMQLKTAGNDTSRLRILSQLSEATYGSKPDISLVFAQQCYELAARLGNEKYKANSFALMASAYGVMADYGKNIVLYVKALKIYENAHDGYNVIRMYVYMSDDYLEMKDYQVGMRYAKKADSVFQTLTPDQQNRRFKSLEMIATVNIGECYLFTGKLDAAEGYLQKTYQYAKVSNKQDMISYSARDLGELAAARGQKDKALLCFREAFASSIKSNDLQSASVAQLSIANLYQKTGIRDSATVYARKALQMAQSGKFRQDALNAYMALYRYYNDENDLPEAFKYYKMATAIKDSLFSRDVTQQLVSAGYEERQNQLEVAAIRERYQNKIRLYALAAGVAILLLLLVIFWRNGRQRKKANILLQAQKEEITSALKKLEQTKDQLIQSEKMASLGELTAGIAHEIQNPLNFVNNFSDVNNELIDELRTELDKGDLDEARAIAADIQENEKRINMHGKRADSIVKGMLEHSRASTGQKEYTDINKLADEYLHLAYHGLRAKDKSFNAELVTHFDETLPLINVIPQDIGRVLLNLFNNAFYAVHQKQKTENADFKPTIEVSTLVKDGRMQLIVKDNGNGIPNNIKDKIMQPFFTTKPTGEGTGLGLSLSYDIVVKGHGGTINVISEERRFTQFEISIPG